MKFEHKLLAALIAASLNLGGSINADDKDKRADEPAGAEVQSGNTDTELEAEVEIDEAAGAETDDLSPEKFAKKAHQSGMAEVAIGQLAAQRGESSSVKQFGDKIARDHKEANKNLETLAERRQIKLDRVIGKKYQEKIEHFTSLTGEEFDREFIKHTAQHHRKDIKQFEKQAKEGEDPAIRSYASETLPVLREHLKIAETLQENRNASIPELQEPAGAETPGQDQPGQLQPDDDDEEDDDDDAGVKPADSAGDAANGDNSNTQP